MIFQNKAFEEKKNTAKESINLEKDSLQYNCQDLDQEQKVDVNPVQTNNQTLHIHLSNDSFYGKINGTTYLAKNKEFVENAEVFLFFGHECKIPIYKTTSDHSGNFVIEEIPPGYYTLFAQLGANLKYRSEFIKVLPGANVHHLIYLNTWL